MKHSIRKGRKVIAALMALLLVAMTGAIAMPAAVAEGGTHTVAFRIMTEKDNGIPYAYKTIKEEVVADNGAATAPDSSEIPRIPYNIHYEYVFTGWNREFSNVTEDLVVEAQYVLQPKKYEIVYCNHDGTEVLLRATETYGEPLSSVALIEATYRSGNVSCQYTLYAKHISVEGSDIDALTTTENSKKVEYVATGNNTTTNTTDVAEGAYTFSFVDGNLVWDGEAWAAGKTFSGPSHSATSLYDYAGTYTDAEGTTKIEIKVISAATAKVFQNPRTNDNRYAYSFNGKWETEYARTNKTGEYFTDSQLNFTESEMETVMVYALYDQRLIRYPVTVCVVDRDNAPVEGAKVQISVKINVGDDYSNPQYLAEGEKVYGTTDENGFCNLEVNYSDTGYQISAVWPDDDSQSKVCDATINDFKSRITIQLDNSSQYHADNQPRCTHICHSFIGGLYITGLNLLYRIFHVKYVCCYDMYATHGDKLAYTP